MLHRDTWGVIAFCKWAASRPSVIALYCTFTVCPRRAGNFLCIAYSGEVAGADKVGLEDHQGLEESAARKVIIDTNLHIMDVIPFHGCHLRVGQRYLAECWQAAKLLVFTERGGD